MPFTIAHAAVAAPIWAASRRRLVLSALVIGTMVPDAEYYVHLRTKAEYHSWSGIVLFGVPVSLALLWLLHRVVKKPALMLIPERWSHLAAAADREFHFLPPSRMMVIVVSILIGAASHLLLDAFTHRGAWGVEMFPVLQETWLSVGGVSLAGYKVLQYGCGAGGMMFLGGWLLLWISRQPRDVPSKIVPLTTFGRIAATAFIVCATVLTSALAAQWRYHTPGLEQPTYASLVSGVIGAVTGFCVGMLLFAIAVHLLRGVAAENTPASSFSQA